MKYLWRSSLQRKQQISSWSAQNMLSSSAVCLSQRVIGMEAARAIDGMSSRSTILWRELMASMLCTCFSHVKQKNVTQS